MFVTIFNHLNDTSKTYSGDDAQLYAALKADYGMQANFNHDLFSLIEDIRRIQYLDVKSSPFSQPWPMKNPHEAVKEVQQLTSVDYAPHTRIILSHFDNRLPQSIEGSSQEIVRELTRRYPDYASYAGNGLKALCDLITARHPTVSAYYGDALKHPRWTGEPPCDYDHRPSAFPTWEAYNNIPPMPKQIGKTEGFADDTDEL
jgi:hypothetical protein